MLNIPSYIEDNNYRYRMPKMQLKIQSKGNGIKTNIVNLDQVAKHLRTDEQYILKFFGFQKASQTIFKEAGGKNNTNYIINGEFNQQDMQKSLDKYIQKYVCCPKCKLPEMHMIIVNQKIHGKCDSCPFTGQLDNKHKLTAFILKNPPTAKDMASGKVLNKEQKSHKPNTKQHDKKKNKSDEKVEIVTANSLFDAKNMEFGSKQLSQLVQYMRKFIDSRKEDDFDIKSAYIVSELKPLGLKKSLLAYVIFNSIFTINIGSQIGTDSNQLYLNLMKKLIITGTETQTLLNLQYLFLQVHKDEDFSKFLPTIMMKIFQKKLLSQEFIKQWGSQQGIKDIQNNFMFNPNRDIQFKKIVQDFIDWVKDDEDEQEEEKQ